MDHNFTQCHKVVFVHPRVLWTVPDNKHIPSGHRGVTLYGHMTTRGNYIRVVVTQPVGCDVRILEIPVGEVVGDGYLKKAQPFCIM